MKKHYTAPLCQGQKVNVYDGFLLTASEAGKVEKPDNFEATPTDEGDGTDLVRKERIW